MPCVRELTVPCAWSRAPADDADHAPTCVTACGRGDAPDRVCCAGVVGDRWEDVTCRDFLDEVSAVAKGLVAAGVGAGRPGRASCRSTRVRVDAGRLRHLVRGRRHRADLRDLLRRAGRVDPRRLRRGRRASSRRRAHAGLVGSGPRPAARRCAHVWPIDDGASTRCATAGASVAATSVVDRARRDAGAGPPGHDHLHLGHHRAPQGLRADPREPAAEAPSNALARPATGCSAPDGSTLLFLPLAHVFARIIEVGCIELRGHARALRRHQRPCCPTSARSGRRSSWPCRGCSRRSTTAPGRRRTRDGKGAIFDRAADAAIAYSRGAGRPGGPGLAAASCSTRCSTGWSTASCGPRSAAATEYAVSGGAPLGARLGHFFRGIGVTCSRATA